MNLSRSLNRVAVVLSFCLAVSASIPNCTRALEHVRLPQVDEQFVARDTLNCDAEEDADTADCLAGLRWTPAEFAVMIETPQNKQGDLAVTFPSPHPSGNPVHDRVFMEWYAARDQAGQVGRAPAVVVVHESGRSMPVGRLVARGLSVLGVHAFMIQMPGYGQRRTELADRPEHLVQSMRQAVGDVRRAYDAVAALPVVDQKRLGVQGTSLGGFVTATVLGLDSAYSHGFILLAGGQLDRVLLEGARDAAKMRAQLQSIGIDDDQLRQLVKVIEPLRLAKRVDPDRTWLYRGAFDNVVPPASSLAFAEATGLSDQHHIVMPVDHYTGVILLPGVLQQIANQMLR